MIAALAALFDRRDVGVTRSLLRAGAALFNPGDPATHLYLTREGLMAVFDTAGSDDPRLTGFIRRAETVGEMALLAETARTRGVVALRDCIVDAVGADALFAAAGNDPSAMVELARLVARRAGGNHAPSLLPRAVLITGVAADCDPHGLAMALAVECTALGFRVVALDSAALAADAGRIAAAEITHEIVFISARAEEASWAAACRSQGIERWACA
ncbi:MAG: Crp/Fnr family transcriptional regulator [Janthinobacterium lividum]